MEKEGDGKTDVKKEESCYIQRQTFLFNNDFNETFLYKSILIHAFILITPYFHNK